MKRIFLFLLTNIGILIVISVILSITGANNYLSGTGINIPMLLIFSTIIGFSGSFISLLISKWMAKTIYRINVINTPTNETEKYLIDTITTLSQKANIPMPEVGIYEEMDINAFATGPSKSNSIVAVSRGLLEKMNKDEIEGVLGHEISHISNGDMVTLTLVQGVLNTFVVFFSRILAYIVDKTIFKNEEENVSFGYYIISFIFEIILGILAMMVVMYFSRIREYSADHNSASITSKDKMIAALKKIKQYYEVDKKMIKEHAGFNAFQISNNNSWFNMFSTHPSLDDRIEKLEKEI